MFYSGGFAHVCFMGNARSPIFCRHPAAWVLSKTFWESCAAGFRNSHLLAFSCDGEYITYHDTREIFEGDGVTIYTGGLRTLLEIRNAKDAYELSLCAFRDRRPLDKALLKEFQLCLTKNAYDTRRWQLGERSGEYKRHDYVTG